MMQIDRFQSEIASQTRSGTQLVAIMKTEHNENLDQIAPQTVLDLYLAERRDELAKNTLRSHKYVLNHFVGWCEQNEIQSVATLDGRQLHEYRIERREDVSGNTLKSQLGTIRQYIRFAESIEAAPTGLSERIRMPQIERNPRDGRITDDKAQEIMEHLDQFQYASRDHVVFRLLWKTAVRVGTARSFDIADFNYEDKTIAARHRPDSDTPLKNGTNAERLMALDEQTTEIISDYIDHTRIEITDEYDRNPLFTSKRGRLGVSTLRRTIYKWSRPCVLGNGCPHDRIIDDCEAYNVVAKGAECPSSRSPHEVRRGSISHLLNENTPVRAISDRADVSEDILDQHYDARGEKEQMESRRQFFE